MNALLAISLNKPTFQRAVSFLTLGTEVACTKPRELFKLYQGSFTSRIKVFFFLYFAYRSNVKHTYIPIVYKVLVRYHTSLRLNRQVQLTFLFHFYVISHFRHFYSNELPTFKDSIGLEDLAWPHR